MGGGGRIKFPPFKKKRGGAQKVVPCLEEGGGGGGGHQDLDRRFSRFVVPLPMINDQSLRLYMYVVMNSVISYVVESLSYFYSCIWAFYCSVTTMLMLSVSDLH